METTESQHITSTPTALVKEKQNFFRSLFLTKRISLVEKNLKHIPAITSWIKVNILKVANNVNYGLVFLIELMKKPKETIMYLMLITKSR